VAASAIPFAEGWPAPAAMSEDDIAELVHAFARAARRAERAGFDFVEIHAAHGYLLNTFLSPLSNRRSDRYGGTLENRMRAFREIFKAIKDAVPHLPVGVRISATEWVEGGFDLDEAVAFASAAGEMGIAYVCVSSGGNAHHQKLSAGPGYQLPFAARIRRETGVVTRAVGRIDTPELAEQALADGAADLIAIARPILADPRWPWRAAVKLGGKIHPVRQYERAWPTLEAAAKG
jgi:2,4-dienoyl-CoA reductase-like NADH-dependent reductase (Old Yellow Enzyme family)